MRILALSDIHLEHSKFDPDSGVVAAADVIVLAGDIHPGVDGIQWARYAFADKPIIYVAGNHEFYGAEWERALDDMRRAGNANDVYFLENGSVEILGIKFLGCTLWSDFNYFGAHHQERLRELAEKEFADYGSIHADADEVCGQLTTALSIARHETSLAWLRSELANQDRSATVVVTHHFPNKKSCSPKYSNDAMTAAFGTHIDTDLMHQAGLWIHGHTHSSTNYRIGDSKRYVRVVCNPRGYPLGWSSTYWENEAFDPNFLIERLPDGNWGLCAGVRA